MNRPAHPAPTRSKPPRPGFFSRLREATSTPELLRTLRLAAVAVLCPTTRGIMTAAVVALAATIAMPPATAAAQGVHPEHRPVVEVRVLGLTEVPRSLVDNAIRVKPGDPYDAQTVNRDIVRLTKLGRFLPVEAFVEEAPGGGVILTYKLTEQPLLRSVEIVGSKEFTPRELLDKIVLRAGDPVDPFLIERARQLIIKAYQEKGYFIADVSVDEAKLAQDRELVLTVREGPKVRVRAIRFEGNEIFSDRELLGEVKQEVYLPVLRKGNLNRELLTLDAARVRNYLRQRGYLDAQVDRRIDISPDQKSATVTFVVFEGPRYTVDRVRFSNTQGGALLLPDEQLLLAMSLRPGAVFSAEKQQKSEQAIQNLYGKLGYLDTAVRVTRLFDPDDPKVTLDIAITQGRPYTVGKVIVRGNNLTKTKVLLREARGLTPGRRFDRTGLDLTRRRLNESPLFRDATVTILGDDADDVRDVLIEVKERNTGSISFGANLNSDFGIGAAVDINQRNFDISDTPDSWGDLISGRAFRGAGQVFDLTLSPGASNSTYSVSWRDPAFLESDYSLSLSVFLTARDRRDFDEGRKGFQVGLGRRFGDVWSVSGTARYVQVEVDNIDVDSAVDVFAVQGKSDLNAVGFKVVRNTADSLFAPSRGSRTEAGLEQVGLLGGDFEFTRVNLGTRKFWTVDEDFLGRKSVLMARANVGYILQDNEAPIFERFFAGGRSFRGFRFRGAGPRGIRNDTLTLGKDAVGGRFSLLTTLQYEFPLVEDYLRGVIFTDQGTIDNDIAVDRWRVTAGVGVRMKIPFLAQAPFAVDLAIPLQDQDGDETELISFTLDLPFR